VIDPRSIHYSRYRFKDPGSGVESKAFNQGMLRPDELSALAYVEGETAPVEDEMDFDELEQRPHSDRLVIDVGCGRGMLAAALIRRGFRVHAIDFSHDAIQLTVETVTRRADPDRLKTQCIDFADIAHVAFAKRPHAVIFSETLEHIPEEDFAQGWPTVLTFGCLLVIVNFRDLHPIEIDTTGWNHIRRVDDKLYDWIASHGTTLVRDGSHLVVKLET
jgi:SAM-dependent methyltransferase